MWPKEYRDYKKDRFLVKYQVEPGNGIIGCEMHDLNGWGNSLHFSAEEDIQRHRFSRDAAIVSDKSKEVS